MKILISLLIAIFAFSISLHSQVSFSLEGGLTNGQINRTFTGMDEFNETSRYFNFYGGLGVQYPLNSSWSIYSNLLYARRGGTINPSEDISITNRLQMFELHLGIERKVFSNFSIQGGGIMGKVHRNQIRIGDQGFSSLSIENDYVFGYYIGLKYQLNEKVHLNLSWNQFLTRVNEGFTTDANGQFTGSFFDKINSLNIGLGYRF